MSKREYMPIIGTPFAVAMGALNEEQAKINHGQSLDRLAERGGLNMKEASAILGRRRWDRMESTDEAAKALMAATQPHQGADK